MPKIDREQICVAFDMWGCPNRCRHCWLGHADNRLLSEADVRWGVSQFRDFITRGNKPIKKLSVATWFREPDFGEDYRHLYDLEVELSDGKPNRYELLSVWRLARDDMYVKWAKSVGPDTCQISFFGMRETNDWFHRRTGAFDDALTATERLLDAGMKPRLQVFLTTKLLPELDEFLGLVDRYRLRHRVEELGGEFEIFVHLPGPDYEARKVEELRPTAEETAELPEAILKPSRKHFERDNLWHTEEALYTEILNGNDTNRGDDNLLEVLWFFVCSNWDVFANIGILEPWWCLGNLKQDSIESIIRNFEDDGILGLNVQFNEPPIRLAERCGDPKGQKVYSSKEDLLSLYRGKHCEEEWNRR
jgi:hypothetical protein